MGGGAISRFLPLALALALAAGCQSPQLGPRDDSYSISDAPTTKSSALSAAVDVQPAQATFPEVIATPAQALSQLPLSLFDAVEMSLAQNPDLVALRFAEGVSEGALGVAETYPFNPWVQIQVTPFQQSETANTGPTSHYILLMQQLQLAHQRAHRTEAAAAALNSIRWNYVQAKLTNAAQTQRLYFAALYQRGIAELARANAELNNQLLSISQKQFEGGAIAGADVAILRLDNASTRRQAALAEANHQTALLDLKRHLGLAAAVPLVLTGRLADFRWQELTSETPLWTKFACLEMPATADRAWLSHTLASGRPDVWAANADVDTARANLDLARANRIPDLQIGPYYLKSNEPSYFYGFRAQMDIPVLNTGAPLVRQRLAELTQRNVVWEQLLHRATLEVQAALDRYDRAVSIATDSETVVGEELPVELRKLEEQFKAGEVDLVRVITARTSFFQARRATLDTQNELAQASAALVAASGLPPEVLLK